jgi:hypothetical protein
MNAAIFDEPEKKRIWGAVCDDMESPEWGRTTVQRGNFRFAEPGTYTPYEPGFQQYYYDGVPISESDYRTRQEIDRIIYERRMAARQQQEEIAMPRFEVINHPDGSQTIRRLDNESTRF